MHYRSHFALDLENMMAKAPIENKFPSLPPAILPDLTFCYGRMASVSPERG
jgi:hypothetical protein